MDDAAARIQKLLRQLAAIAGFGSFALRQPDLLKVLTEAARACAEALDVPLAKVCRYRLAENDLVIEAGCGWKEGVVGYIYRADETSPQGRSFISGTPTICDDLRESNDFTLPPFYAAHGVISTVDVVIKGNGKPFGVLEIDNTAQHNYDEHDVNFLMSFANVLSEAVATSARTSLLQATIEQMKTLVEDKDRLLEQKGVMAAELQHRVRNNLQLVYGMLNKQLDDTSDVAGQQGLKAIARRVSSLAKVYDHLLGTEMTRKTDFGTFVKSLCHSLAESQTTPSSEVTLTCDSDALLLDLDVVTALGIIVTELVTNSYDHAFPNGKGATRVSVRGVTKDDVMATITVSDNGLGFKPVAETKRHGVGLVRRLIEQVRGTVTLTSELGTVWTIRIPVPQFQ